MKAHRRTPSPWSTPSLDPPTPPAQSSELPPSSPPPDERSESPVHDSWTNEDLTTMLIESQERIAEQALIIDKHESEKATMTATFSRRLVLAEQQARQTYQDKVKSLEREFAWARRCLLNRIDNLKEAQSEAEDNHAETVIRMKRAQKELARQAETLQRELSDLKSCPPELGLGEQNRRGERSDLNNTDTATILKGSKRIRDGEDEVEDVKTSRKRQRM
ncbi:hypothetical protein VNI00_008000 [Paramarasmius palmivorus]|uniref:Uncharacterized protein n=1 Tax=Paramarasmius palmivorus TaxID=297713 RepID=A0AAW0CX97_9AGAR